MPNAKEEILVIDDNHENLKLLHEVLSNKGYLIRSIPNGQLGIESALKRRPDLVLLDINMPGMNGFEVCETFKQNSLLNDIPIIFVSALGETLDIVKALQVGGVDYLTKPFEIEEVEARIGNHLKIKRLQEELETYNKSLTHRVEERTRELAQANTRLEEANRQLSTLQTLKSDFLTMITHEIRTPLNGILGVSDILINELKSDHTLSSTYQDSRKRMESLLHQAQMLAYLETQASGGSPKLISHAHIWDTVKARIATEGYTIDTPSLSTSPNALIDCDPELAIYAATAVSKLACCLSGHSRIHAVHSFETQTIRTTFELPLSRKNELNVTDFFEMGSPARQSTKAETLGLDPVVSARILKAYDGDLFFRQTDGNTELILEMSCKTD